VAEPGGWVGRRCGGGVLLSNGSTDGDDQCLS
jgi:hypothetical protein